MYKLTFTIMVLPTVFSDCTVKYADKSYDDVLHYFFNNKIVLIADYDPDKFRPIVPGIFIDFHLILTAYNPFKQRRIKGDDLDNFKVCVLKDRSVDSKGDYVFKASSHKIICARQIVPTPEYYIERYQTHGYNKTHSPLHDMMVLRINPREYAVRAGYSWLYGADIGFRFPVPVHVAKQFYELRDTNVIIASSGFRDYEHIRESDTILSRTYKTEYVMADCDEWLPRWWGYFICLKNVDDFKGIGAGAMLIHEYALFGIGSFMLNKRNNSILVFTDVRKYYRMLGSACHEYEATDIKRTQAYDRDEFWYYAHHKRTKDFNKLVTKLD